MRRALIVMGSLIALAGTPRAAFAQGAPDFKMSITPPAGSLTDDYILTVETSLRGVDAAERFTPPDLREFQVLDERTNRATQWSYDPVRGQEIRNVETRRWRIQPRRAGRLGIGPAKLVVGGKVYETRSVWVVVGASSASPVGALPMDPTEPLPDPGALQSSTLPPELARKPTFLFATIDRARVRVGEQVVVTWLLYTRSDIRRFDPGPPKLDGFWAETLYEPQRYFTYDDADVGGRAYVVAKVARKALFPTRAGTLTIPPYRAKVGTMSTAFGVPLELASQALTVEVDPLPPGAPAGFDDAYVGTFELEATIDRDVVPAGESLSLALTVKGTGAVRRAGVPRLRLDGFDVRAPTTFDEELDVSGERVRGVRRYLYLLTPTRGGTVPLGPVTIPTFDPDTGRYGLAQASPLVVNVEGDPSVAARTAAGAGDNLIAREIRPLRDAPSAIGRFGVATFVSPRFLWLLGAPGAVWLLVVGGDVARSRLSRETPRARLRRARGRAKRRLKAAHDATRTGAPSQAYAELARAIHEQVEERVGEPVAALTRPELRAVLERRRFPEPIIAAVLAELDRCDFARFAPGTDDDGEDLREATRRVRELLRSVERVRGGGSSREPS